MGLVLKSGFSAIILHHGPWCIKWLVCLFGNVEYNFNRIGTVCTHGWRMPYGRFGSCHTNFACATPTFCPFIIIDHTNFDLLVNHIIFWPHQLWKPSSAHVCAQLGQTVNYATGLGKAHQSCRKFSPECTNKAKNSHK